MRAESQSVPPKIRSAPPLALFAGVVLGMAALGAGAVVFFFNPATHGFYPVCVFHQLTGLNCPGCGGTRSVYALLHGNIRARAEGQCAVCRPARGGGGPRHLDCGKNNPAATGGDICSRGSFVGGARRRRGFHGDAEPAGVRISLAVTPAINLFSTLNSGILMGGGLVLFLVR